MPDTTAATSPATAMTNATATLAATVTTAATATPVTDVTASDPPAPSVPAARIVAARLGKQAPGTGAGATANSGGGNAEPEPSGSPTSNAIWAAVGAVGMNVIRFGGNLVLTRMLSPDDFGLTALVGVLITALHMISDMATGPCIVQSRRGDDPDFLDTAFTLQAIRGAILSACAASLAWPAAMLYGEPRLLWLVPASALGTLIGGFASTSIWTLTRRLQRAPIVMLEFGCYAVSIGVTVAWAAVWPSVWALVVGSTASTLLQVVLGHAVLPGPAGRMNRFRWEPAAADELIGFGRWVFAGSTATLLACQTDRPLMGKLAGMSALGVYNLAGQFAGLPTTLAQVAGDQIIFPMYGRMRRAGEDLSAGFAKLHAAAAGVAALPIAGLLGAGPTIIETLYDNRYADAGLMLRLLAVGSWFGILQTTASTLLLASGRTGQLAAANIVKLAALPVAVIAGWWMAGVTGLVGGFVAAEIVRYVFTAWRLRVDCGVTVLGWDALFTALAVVTGLACEEAGRLAGPGVPPATRLALQSVTVAVVGGSAVAAILLPLWRRPVLQPSAA
jgi:O-antigen/teichoic acid export membrane protein